MRKTIWLLLVVLTFSSFAVSQTEKQNPIEKQNLTIDDIYNPQKKVAFSGFPSSGLRWSSDGTSFVKQRKAANGLQFVRVNAKTGEETVYFDSVDVVTALTKIGLPLEEAKPIAENFVAQSETSNTFLLTSDEDLFVYNAETKTAKQITKDKVKELEADFSPDGKKVSFVKANNLFSVDIAGGKETQFTKDGDKNTLNGYLAWVYEEELYGRGQNRGYWWSPDSTKIVFLRTDDSTVPKFVLADDTETNQNIEDTNYPKSGDPNPYVTLKIANTSTGKVTDIDTSKYKEADFLISRVDWSPDSKWVVYQAQNREQTYLDLNAYDLASGKTNTLFKETSEAWVAVIDNPHWLKDGSFIWESTRDGWQHLYHYGKDGKLIKQITKGDWEVGSFYGVDEKNGFAYFSATEHSHIAPQIYRIKLDGTGLTRLTKKEGSYSANFNPTFTNFVATWSDINTPPQTTLHRADGTIEKVINENKVDVLAKYNLSKPDFLTVKNRDGFEMEAIMIKPPNFDPTKKYPVMSYVYGGPHAPQVRNSWGGSRYIFHQFLAQKGYVIWILDPRSASGKGEKETWTAYKKLGQTEFLDLEDGVKFLKSLPFVDGDRIGIWGWSYGGFMTTYALTHGKSFKIGIAGGTVSDWALYDSIYTERYMLTPENNPTGYAKTSVLTAAKDLSGKLLLIHGAMDNNVHMQNTTKLIYELQKNGKQFDLMLYPTQRHGVSDPNQVYHLYNMMADFVLKNL
ncbi:MAG: S9 family peptidase [Acidobacteriota bacterium]|nr:S9 family peptidase [Acidobacteriota bacterium]